MLWSYEVVAEPTGTSSKYWDSNAPRERETKRLAKQKIIAIKDRDVHMEGSAQSIYARCSRFSIQTSSCNNLDSSDGDFSDCSSVESNPNDVTVVKRKATTLVTVVKRKATTLAKSSPNKKRRGTTMDGSNDAQEKNHDEAGEGKRKSKPKTGKCAQELTYTVDGVLETWDETTDYGIRFRSLTNEDQKSELKILNQGAVKGMKGLMKMKLLAGNYKQTLADKLRQHLTSSRVEPCTMFHVFSSTANVMLQNPSFVSVGEWVEVDADRSPGYNSEGGVAVVISVRDDFVDVK